jgi:two-component system sporulation sensor kinase B
MENTEHLLINLLGLLLSLLVFQFFMNKLYLNRFQTQTITFVTLTLSILTCMLFPVKIPDGFVFDLRLIPFIIGCFYANKLTIYWTIVLIITVRLLHGVDHSWFAIVNIILFYFITWFFRSRFNYLSKVRRIYQYSLLILLMSIWSSVGMSMIFHSYLSTSFYISYIFIQTCGMLIVGYMVESIIEQHLILHKMVRMKKMEVASHLAASISHEVRNPLTSTRGFLQLLTESKELPSAHKDYLSIAINEIDQADSIIRRYLMFAKPAPEKLESFDVKHEIEKVIQILEPLAKINKVDFHLTLDSTQMLGDIGLFQQVLVDLVQNGIEAMPSGGILSISENTENSTIQITICDEGIGMSQLQISRLGEPFFSTKDTKGTGLGMMVVFRIIESMNGKIKVDSKPGEGTKIVLQFPTSALSV